MLEKPAYLLGDFIIEKGLAGSIELYKIGCFGSVIKSQYTFLEYTKSATLWTKII